MYKTKNDIPETTRTAAVTILNARLADAVDLMLQAKQAHWNVKGPDFLTLHKLHKLFDEIVNAAEEYMDLLAERVVHLGGTAEGTVQVAAKRAALKEHPITIISAACEHVEALSSALATFGKSVHQAKDQSNELGDRDTADIFTEISRGVDKYLWFVDAQRG